MAQIHCQRRKVGDDPHKWYDELGDSVEIERYWDRYIREYQRIAGFDDSKSGVTGKAAEEILESIEASK